MLLGTTCCPSVNLFARRCPPNPFLSRLTTRQHKQENKRCRFFRRPRTLDNLSRNIEEGGTGDCESFLCRKCWAMVRITFVLVTGRFFRRHRTQIFYKNCRRAGRPHLQVPTSCTCKYQVTTSPSTQLLHPQVPSYYTFKYQVTTLSSTKVLHLQVPTYYTSKYQVTTQPSTNLHHRVPSYYTFKYQVTTPPSTKLLHHQVPSYYTSKYQVTQATKYIAAK